MSIPEEFNFHLKEKKKKKRKNLKDISTSIL